MIKQLIKAGILSVLVYHGIKRLLRVYPKLRDDLMKLLHEDG